MATSFLVMLGDNILEYSIEASVENFQRQDRGARVLLKEMEDPSHLRHLGVPVFKNGRIVGIQEKPQSPAFAVRGDRGLHVRLERLRHRQDAGAVRAR